MKYYLWTMHESENELSPNQALVISDDLETSTSSLKEQQIAVSRGSSATQPSRSVAHKTVSMCLNEVARQGGMRLWSGK